MKSRTQKLAAFILATVMVVGMPSVAYATHNGYKHSAPTLSSLSVVSCTQVEVTWKRTSNFTSVNYARRSDFRGHLSWFPAEYGTRDQARGATTTVVSHLRPGARYWFRVHASDYSGHRTSKYSNVRSITMPTC